MIKWTLLAQECRAGMAKTLADNSVDAIVTDPPYGLSKESDAAEVLRHWLAGGDYTHGGAGFMGKTWDSFVPGPATWRETFRVLKPGGYALVFAGARTQDLMSMALRLAGYEIRDVAMWLYGSGFPKSLDVSKAVATRETHFDSTFEAIDSAEQWAGWGTALKPAYEPIIIARKPLDGTVADNVLRWGTGAINVDGCRVPAADAAYAKNCSGDRGHEGNKGRVMGFAMGAGRAHDLGRWPANILHDGSDEVVGLLPVNAGAAAPVKGAEPSPASSGHITGRRNRVATHFHGDSGSAARFFYCAKASPADRNAGCQHLPHVSAGGVTGGRAEGSDGLNSPRAGAGRGSGNHNHHPTVKPTDLMRWCCRLVTPPGGLILDPFAGSGSTGRGAMLEGFNFLGFEMDESYARIAEARIAQAFDEYMALQDGYDLL